MVTASATGEPDEDNQLLSGPSTITKVEVKSRHSALNDRSAITSGYPTPPASVISDDPNDRTSTVGRLDGIEEEEATEGSWEQEVMGPPLAFPAFQPSIRSPSPAMLSQSASFPGPAARKRQQTTITPNIHGFDGDSVRTRGRTIPSHGSTQQIGELQGRLSPSKPPSAPRAEPAPLNPFNRIDQVLTPSGHGSTRDPARQDFSGDRASVGREERQTIADRRSRAGSLGLPLAPGAQKDSSAGPQTARPHLGGRTVSTPPMLRRKHSHGQAGAQPFQRTRHPPAPLHLDDLRKPNPSEIGGDSRPIRSPDPTPSPMPQIIPLPPVSLHTYLQLELSSHHPSPLYIHRSAYNDFPYESSAIKFQRICNFILVYPQIEQVLLFGALACFDAWLYNVTILPLRFLKAIGILVQSFWVNAHEITGSIRKGWRRTLKRYRGRPGRVPDTPVPAATSAREDVEYFMKESEGVPPSRTASCSAATQSRVGFTSPVLHSTTSTRPRHGSSNAHKRHRRTQSQPSNLLPGNKADILKGGLVGFGCFILQALDASQMYHDIKGQAAIKLYVVFSMLDVADRLLSAFGQDILECLCSRETLERKQDGRSKVLRPMGMFALALIYTVAHSSVLFYQLITLNVAVNSYSSALLSLLLSSQFVEIKGTVFKKFEKENLFQLTCADVVERFQLGFLLTIIALRNVAEMGVGIITGPDSPFTSASGAGAATEPAFSMLPKAFTIFPSWTGRVTGPFLLVLGSEMLVDWLKHAYIGKFNNVKPAIYGRYLDVLAKDYYTNAFADQNLTKRLGLPVIPLSCVVIRVGMQLWQTFWASSEAVLGSKTTYAFPDSAGARTSSTTTASLQKFDNIWAQILQPSVSAAGSQSSSLFTSWLSKLVSALPTVSFILTAYLIALIIKLFLGMALLHFSRNRYHTMKERESHSVEMAGNRVGGWGVVEVDADKRRWIYEGDPEGMRLMMDRVKEKERRLGPGGGVDADDDGAVGKKKGKEAGKSSWGVDQLKGVSRWNMSGKRIW